MKLIRRSILSLLAICCVLSLPAQTLRSAYFLETMPMRHKLNPALVSERGYVGIPLLTNLSVGVQSNVGINTFLFPMQNGQLTTFMSGTVDADRFLSKIKNNNAARVDVDLTLLSGAFYAWGGFNTVDLSARSVSDVNLPGELFTFIKRGQDRAEGSQYRIRNLKAESDNYVQLAFGHARPVGDRWTVGGKAKVLFGAGSARASIDQMDVLMSEDKWMVNSRGSLNMSARGASFKSDVDGQITGLDYDTPGLSGMGLGVDLGATFRPLERLTLSVGLTDLGFICWRDNMHGATRKDTFVFEGFTNLSDTGDNTSIDEQTDQLKADLEDLTRFYDQGLTGGRTNSLKTTLTVGSEYGILDNKISFGVLSTTRFGTIRTWTEVMAAANFRPCSWYNVAVTGSWSNDGPGWGWVMNFSPRGFNFFFGTDYMVTRVTPQYAPVGRATLHVNFGMSVPIGAKRNAHFAFK